MIRKRVILCFSAMISVAASFSALASSANVDITFNHQDTISASFPHIPRLDEAVLEGLQKTQADWEKIDWLASGLYDLNSPFLLKQQVLRTLQKQKQTALQQNNPSWYYWYQLTRDLKEINFEKKVFQSVDPDITRLDVSKNPRLHGHWLITLQENEKSVLVLGNIKNSGKRPWQQRKGAIYYAKASGLLDGSISEITVIQPDGHVEKHSVAYWNKNFSEIAPGATIYVPIPIERPLVHLQKDNHQNANDLVVELLRNRLP